MSPLRAPFTTTMWMVYRIHGCTAYRWSSTQPASATGFTMYCVFMIGVTHLTNGGTILPPYLPQFSGRQSKKDITTFFRHHLGVTTSGAAQLSAPSVGQFHIVYPSTQRNPH
jgi:hypothetical protein